MVKKKGYMYLDLGRALVNYDPLFTIKREKIQNFLNLSLSLSLSGEISFLSWFGDSKSHTKRKKRSESFLLGCIIEVKKKGGGGGIMIYLITH